MTSERGYDDIAEEYHGFVGASSVHRVSIPALLDMCGPGTDVVDLAGGDGILARRLAATGCRVVGVDRSVRLLGIAEQLEAASPLGIEYRAGDARNLACLSDSSYDGVACNLALSDLDDLGSVFASVRRVLHPGGWFAFCALHPCFQRPGWPTVNVEGGVALQVREYFDEGAFEHAADSRVLGRMPWYHRTLSSLLQGLLDAGFTLNAIAEPRPSPDVVAESPIYAQVATVLVVSALRPAA